MKLVTVAEMRAIEQEADTNGLSYAKMMENAGHGLAEEIEALAYAGQDEDREVLALVGPGNNGGDALVALTRLAADGWRARAYLVKRQAEGDELVERFKKEGGEILSAEKDADFTQLTAFIETADVVVDGVLGTGIKLPLKPEIARVLEAANQAISSLSGGFFPEGTQPANLVKNFFSFRSCRGLQFSFQFLHLFLPAITPIQFNATFNHWNCPPPKYC
mgnify:CR=1 FL=1